MTRQKLSSRHGSPLRIPAAILALALIASAWWQLTAPGRELLIRHDRVARPDGAALPVSYVVHPGEGAAEAAPARRRPGVLVAHGFGASRRMMMGYAYTLAFQGYAVVLWDFAGHAGNAGRLDDSREVLQDDVDAALDYLLSQPEVDPERLAIVGHSMGSGAAMQAGIRLPGRFDAVVALSPTGAPVTDALPRNLLLQAGSWEQRFLANARDLLGRAGGADTTPAAFAAGRARDLVEIPRAEHITVLYRHASQQAVLDWMNATFRPDRISPTGSAGAAGAYRDRRALYVALQFLGFVVLAFALRPLLRRAAGTGPAHSAARAPAQPRRGWWLVMITAPFAATGLLAAAGALAEISEIGGMLVGGALALWFAAYGLLWLLLGTRPAGPSGRSILVGVGVFAFLWVALGLGTQQLALQWLLIPYRLLRWPLAALLALPYLLAAAELQTGAGAGRRVALYLGQTLPVVGALALAGLSVPGFYILVLMIPALPLVFLATSLTAGLLDEPWGAALGNAAFFGWLLVSLFPLAG